MTFVFQYTRGSIPHVAHSYLYKLVKLVVWGLMEREKKTASIQRKMVTYKKSNFSNNWYLPVCLKRPSSKYLLRTWMTDTCSLRTILKCVK